jgi:hypothetical protein
VGGLRWRTRAIWRIVSLLIVPACNEEHGVVQVVKFL